jgi:hypothetical protein
VFAIWAPMFAVTQETANTNTRFMHALTCRFSQLFAMFAMFAVSRQYPATRRNS